MLEFNEKVIVPTHPNLRRKLNSRYMNLAVKMMLLSWFFQFLNCKQKFFGVYYFDCV